jgi:NAD(P)-dependent dehydrogenase (short-subunit alcohol dehydrogenase family)
MNQPGKIVELKHSQEDIAHCLKVLKDLAENSAQLAQLSTQQVIELKTASGKISRPDRAEIRKRERDKRLLRNHKIDTHQRQARAKTGIRAARETAVFSAPAQIAGPVPQDIPELKKPCSCYVCKEDFTKVHFFYDLMCPKCADFNYAKRFQTASLAGQTAIITGSRLKIGYQASLMMLRAGAQVIATTRFPVDSAMRYAREKDFGQWGDRLHIYGLDLRHTPSVEIFCKFIEHKYDRLDLLVNNAAQTVRRPPGFYAHMMPNELLHYEDLSKEVQGLLGSFEQCKKELGLDPKAPVRTGDATLPVSWNGKLPGVGLSSSAQLSQIPYVHDQSLSVEKVFPDGKLDADLQQVDLRDTNSWRLRLGEIQTSEMIELQLVNAIAPFVLCNKLSWMMKRQNTGQKHIVNVSAMEGKFHRFVKTDRHPHTNMAKAALNMLTHTSASDLAKYGIFMNAVDTGWVTDEDPYALSMRKQKDHDFQPPLDIVDGAARVCDPFFNGILTGEHVYGKFLKDYVSVDW